MKTRLSLPVLLGLAGSVVLALPAACSGGFSGTEGTSPSCREVSRSLSSDEEVVPELGFSAAQLLERLGGVYETEMEWLPIDTPPHRQTGKESLTITLERAAGAAEFVLCERFENLRLDDAFGGAGGAAEGGAGGAGGWSFGLSNAEYEDLTSYSPFIRVPVVVHLVSDSGTLDESLELDLKAYEVGRAQTFGFLPPDEVMGSVREDLLELSNDVVTNFGLEVIFEEDAVQGRWSGGFGPHDYCATNMVVFPPRDSCYELGRPLSLDEENARRRFERAVKQLEGEHQVTWTDGSPSTSSLQLSLREGSESHCIEENSQVAYFSVEIALRESSGRFEGVLQGTLEVDETVPGLPRVTAWNALGGGEFDTNQGTFDAALMNLWLSRSGGHFGGYELEREGFASTVPVGDSWSYPGCFGASSQWPMSFMWGQIEDEAR